MEFLPETNLVLSISLFLLFLTIGLNELMRKHPRKTRAFAEWLRRRPLPDDSKNNS